MFATSLFASVYARGIFQDGVYYLYRIAERQWFHLVDPARTTVQALRQAPIVLLTRFSELSLFERGQTFTFVMLSLPAMLCAVCWWIAPTNRKGWIVFPVLHLSVGISATSFNAVGEAGIAASYWWCLIFLLIFRTRRPISQLLFLVLCVLAFRLHEGAFPLMLLLLVSCAIRFKRTEDWRNRGFLALSILLIAGITFYELLWVIDPRVPADRAMVLRALANFEYIFHSGHINLPLITGTVALLALAGISLIQWLLPASAARLHTLRLAVAFCIFSTIAAAMSLFVETTFSPDAQVLARYHPVFVSFGLGLVMLAFQSWNVPERIWLQPATLLVIAVLSVTQATADIAATLRWRSYVDDLQSRLTTTRGLIRWEDTLATGDPKKDVNWRLMSIEWVIPLVCIVLSKNGLVTTMIDPRPEMTFRPVDPNSPDRLPVLRGVDFSPYRAALAGSGKP
jgi:hypothetical protein